MTLRVRFPSPAFHYRKKGDKVEKYYENPTTGTIHIVADLPKPKRDGHTNCGRLVESLVKITRPKAQKNLHRGCKTCKHYAL
jgi:hypothetical protein